jgi:hypothetical protein
MEYNKDGYRIFDPKAPRVVKERYNILMEKSFYKDLKDEYPELKRYTNIQIRKFIENFNKRIVDEAIENRAGVKLMSGLGLIVIGGCKLTPETAKKNIDHAASRKYNKRIYYQNNHTDKYVGKVKYSSEAERYYFPNHHFWCFDATRPFYEKVSEQFNDPDGWKKYIVFTKNQHISHLFRKQKIYKEKKVHVDNRKRRLEQFSEFSFEEENDK